MQLTSVQIMRQWVTSHVICSTEKNVDMSPLPWIEQDTKYVEICLNSVASCDWMLIESQASTIFPRAIFTQNSEPVWFLKHHHPLTNSCNSSEIQQYTVNSQYLIIDCHLHYQVYRRFDNLLTKTKLNHKLNKKTTFFSSIKPPSFNGSLNKIAQISKHTQFNRV